MRLWQGPSVPLCRIIEALPGLDLFGAAPKVTRQDVLNRLRKYRDGKDSVENKGGGQPAPQAAAQPAAGGGGQGTGAANAGASDLFPAATAEDQANADQQALIEAQKGQQRP